MSDSDRLQVTFEEEISFGVDPGGTRDELRFTSESLGQDTDSVTSTEIRADRQVVDVVRTNITVSGDVNFELSYDAFDTFFQAALQASAFSTLITQTDTDISIDDSDNSVNQVAGDFGATGYVVGQWIRISGYSTAANNNIFKIVSVAALKMVLSHGIVVTETAGASITVLMGPQIINGTAQRSFVIEKEFTDLTNQFELNLGNIIDTFAIDAAVQAIVTGSFGFLGKISSSETASGGGGTTPAPTNEIINSVDDILKVIEGGLLIDATAFNFATTNNLRQRPILGLLGPQSIGAGKFTGTGVLQKYFESEIIMDKYLNDTVTDLVKIYQDGAGNSYVVEFPSVKYTSGRRVAGGENTDILADLSWTAFRDAVEGITMRFAKFDA